MKKSIYYSLFILATLLSFSSCSNDDDDTPVQPETKESYIDATTKNQWSYFSLSENKLVGVGKENETDNATWASRKDWDIAICRYNVRTNSGKATSVGAQGGVYTCAENLPFSSITSVPEGAQFVVDDVVTSRGMGGVTSVVESKATVITFQTNEDGSLVMPPVYLKSPVYIFRTADGNNFYKVEFTQYQDENKVTGHVKFNSTIIIK